MSDVRVLVVDDEALQLELIERALSRDGFAVRGASTLAEIASIGAEHAPQIVLLDVNMPKVTGEQTVAAARAAAPDARVILYSSWEASKLRAIVATLGADGYLSKSESVVAIGARLREILR